MTFNIRDFADKELKAINQKFLYPDTIQVNVLTETGSADDDIFDIPSVISSGTYTLLCQWETQISDRFKMLEGGRSGDGSAYFQTDNKHLDTLKNNRSYVLKDGKLYRVVEIMEGVGASEIIVRVEKRNE